MAFARDILDEAHITSPQVSAGSVAGLHIDLTEDGDRELTSAGVVQLRATTKPARASDDAWEIQGDTGNRRPSLGSDVDLFQVRLASVVAPNAVEPRPIGRGLPRLAQDRGGPQKHQDPERKQQFFVSVYHRAI